MPCWSVQESTIELLDANSMVLQQGLGAVGFTNHRAIYRGFTMERLSDRASVTLREGRVTVAIRGKTADLAALTSEVKRAYSAQVVLTASRRFGWTVKQVGANRYQAQRRG